VRSIVVVLLAVTCADACASRGKAAASKAHPITHASVMGTTIEGQDKALAAALFQLRLAATPARHRAVGDEYLRLGIRDMAFDQYTAATRLDPKDAVAYDALARIWRDWGFPEMGIGDAQRAVRYAPRSPAAHNTLGTLLAKIGRTDEARREFAAALDLDPTAEYARTNLCSISPDALAGDAAAPCPAAPSAVARRSGK
jgi:tetratricopeptide (TPR) repeat protein